MKQVLATVWLVMLAATPVLADASFEKILAFEAPHDGGKPFGWGGGPRETLFVDGEVVHGGEWAGRIEREADSEREFSTLTNSLPLEVGGTTLELRGFLRLEGVVDWAGLWLRQDGEAGSVAFDNMQQRELRGTLDWAEYSIKLPLKREARKIVFGALLAGEGRIWVDDLQLLVDGKPIAEAPALERPETVHDTDREFESGSGIEISGLTQAQVENLARLGKVWGFLKYHHPKVTAGEAHWDYELFRVLPKVLRAGDRRAANTAILEWAKSHGEIPPCDSCAEPPVKVHLRPDLDWIRDREELGAGLGDYLEEVYRNRHPGGEQYYVSLVPGIGNPSFSNEKGYADLESVDAGYRILALFRFWNIIEYWFPYRDQIDDDWDSVLAEFLPAFVEAAEPDAYTLEMLALVVRVRDGHANMWRSLDLRPPRGACGLPVRTRFVEDKAVVVGYTHEEKGPQSGLKIGDAILALDGTSVERMIETRLPWYAGSNRASRLRGIVESMTRGDCVEVAVRVQRAGKTLQLRAERIALDQLDRKTGWTHLPGETFQLLSDDVAYLKLSSIRAADATDYIRRAEKTRGLIIDIRNYPSEFVVFALGRHLVAEDTPFVRFTFGDLSNPGAFFWGDPLLLRAAEPHYQGKVVILVDEASMSQAEYTSMAFRSGPNATVVGTPTAGADGNVSPIPLPGGLQTMISGIGVFYPDKTPTQRVGIVPDIEVRRSIEGVRQGRDEVLEEALRQIRVD